MRANKDGGQKGEQAHGEKGTVGYRVKREFKCWRGLEANLQKDQEEGIEFKDLKAHLLKKSF